MPGHDIVAMGASAGGVRALQRIFAGMQPGIDASFFVVQHVGAGVTSVLPKILASAGALPASHARDGERFRRGHVYVAPPDHHLLLERDTLRLVRGPRENTFRPSVDVLFRSAARAFGPRVIGVVLTGYLGDGAAGLQAIKRRGGIALVQDPLDAEYPDMPMRALREVDVDRHLKVSDLPGFLAEAVALPAANDKDFPMDKDLKLETDIAAQTLDSDGMLKAVVQLGAPTPFTCPECNGAIWQLRHADPPRFRCHTGHSYTAEAFLVSQSSALEDALRSAQRLMEEKHAFLARLEARMREQGLHEAARRYVDRARELEAETQLIRQLILDGASAHGEADAT